MFDRGHKVGETGVYIGGDFEHMSKPHDARRPSIADRLEDLEPHERAAEIRQIGWELANNLFTS